MCHINPNNLNLLYSVSGLFLLCVLFSLIFGKTYSKRLIIRSEDPMAFWMAVMAYFLLGMMLIIGIQVCQ